MGGRGGETPCRSIQFERLIKIAFGSHTVRKLRGHLTRQEVKRLVTHEPKTVFYCPSNCTDSEALFFNRISLCIDFDII